MLIYSNIFNIYNIMETLKKGGLSLISMRTWVIFVV